MKLQSNSFENGKPIPSGFAMGTIDSFGGDQRECKANRHPHLAWSNVPDGTRSFALLCIDPDAPSDASLGGKAGVEIPVDHVRADFVHWVMADIPANVHEIAAGSASDGIVKRGDRRECTAKRNPPGPNGTNQGLNDYTGWFASDADMAGDYRGYDGPCPPPNDLRMHRYFFRLFALDVPSLDLLERFGTSDVQRAMQGHVLAEALTYGTYSLHLGN